MMNDYLQKHHRAVFYSFWFLLGIVQASATELLDDEAYYWVFSQFLDWGYFDHPPLTALFIKLGSFVLPAELGVRFFMVVLNTATIAICQKLTAEKDASLFYTICLSLAVLQIGGFLAVPDNPLMFFTALFFLSYQRFVQKPSLGQTFLFAFVVAGLLYSKYHAALIIFFTLLSNLSLLKRWHIYVAGVIALLLYTPHLWWQYQHGWISFKYHLFESNVNPYKISYTTDYILGQLLIAGPLAGFIFWYAIAKYKTQSLTERALKATGLGILIFFFISTFKGKVEANWTAPAIISIIVLSHQYLLHHAKWRKLLLRLLIPTLVLVVLLRIVIVVNVLPVKAIVQKFHQYNNWPKELKQKTGGLPAVLSSSYQKSSKYWFYSGQTTFSLNEYNRRRNNYNFWPIEDSIFGQPVAVLGTSDSIVVKDSMQTAIGIVHYSIDSSFHSFGKVMFVPAEDAYIVNANQTFTLSANVEAPAMYVNYLKQHPQADYDIKLGLFDAQQWLTDMPVAATLQSAVQGGKVALQVQAPEKKGTYYLRVAVNSDAGWYTHNSEKIKVIVK